MRVHECLYEQAGVYVSIVVSIAATQAGINSYILCHIIYSGSVDLACDLVFCYKPHLFHVCRLTVELKKSGLTDPVDTKLCKNQLSMMGILGLSKIRYYKGNLNKLNLFLETGLVSRPTLNGDC